MRLSISELQDDDELMDYLFNQIPGSVGADDGEEEEKHDLEVAKRFNRVFAAIRNTWRTALARITDHKRDRRNVKPKKLPR